MARGLGRKKKTFVLSWQAFVSGQDSIGVLLACMSENHLSAGEARRRNLSLQNQNYTDGVSSEYSELHPGLLPDQQVLLTNEPLLQSCLWDDGLMQMKAGTG